MLNFKWLVLFLLVLGSVNCQSDELNILRGTFALQLVLDRIQTQKIANDPNAYESNFALGKEPSIRRQNIYFPVAGLIVIGASYFITAEYRKPYMYFFNGLQLGYVSNNLSAGYGFKF